MKVESLTRRSVHQLVQTSSLIPTRHTPVYRKLSALRYNRPSNRGSLRRTFDLKIQFPSRRFAQQCLATFFSSFFLYCRLRLPFSRILSHPGDVKYLDGRLLPLFSSHVKCEGGTKARTGKFDGAETGGKCALMIR